MVAPTFRELQAAAGKRVPDLIAPGLDVLFVGINPGLYSAAIGHHFGRPGEGLPGAARRDAAMSRKITVPFPPPAAVLGRRPPRGADLMTGSVLDYLRRLTVPAESAALSDACLLRRFAAQHDQAAFTLL